MRAPRLFRSEIADYRQRFVAQVCNEPERGIGLQVLERWEAHADRERIWDAIGPKLECSATQFIDLVISRRMLAEELATTIEETPRLKARTSMLTKKYSKSGTHWHYVADLARGQADYNQMFARMFGRKAQLEPRLRFMDGWSDKFEELCGFPFDWVVAALTEIAFDLPVTPDAVRMRRANRRIRPPK
jgi:hypothetical protein